MNEDEFEITTSTNVAAQQKL